MTERVCKGCGASMEGRVKQARYCTHECKVRSVWQRQNERRKSARPPRKAVEPAASLRRRLEAVRDAITPTSDGCWLWPNPYEGIGGYGMLSTSGRKKVLAHRAAYETWVGPIGEGLTIHHTCATRACFNPEHLQPVTAVENTAEMRERTSYKRRIKALEERVAALEAEVERLR